MEAGEVEVRIVRWIVVLSMLWVGTLMLTIPDPVARADEPVTEEQALALAASIGEPVGL